MVWGGQRGLCVYENCPIVLYIIIDFRTHLMRPQRAPDKTQREVGEVDPNRSVSTNERCRRYRSPCTRSDKLRLHANLSIDRERLATHPRRPRSRNRPSTRGGSRCSPYPDRSTSSHRKTRARSQSRCIRTYPGISPRITHSKRSCDSRPLATTSSVDRAAVVSTERGGKTRRRTTREGCLGSTSRRGRTGGR